MKIVLVLSSPPGYSETFFRSKIKGLQAQGHELILVTGPSQRTFDLCKHIKHPKRYANNLRQLMAMLWVFIGLLPHAAKVNRYWQLERKQQTPAKRILEKIYLNARLLHCHADWLHFGFASMALDRELVAEAIGAKMAVSLRGYDIGVYPLKYPQAYDLLWQKVDKLHVISDDLYQLALARGLTSKTKVQKITPAIDIEMFQHHSILALRQKGKLNLLSVGRLHWKKGFADTLMALQILKTRDVDFTYTIIGEGQEYERLAYTAYELGLAKQVVFSGKRTREEVKQAMLACDLYLQYSIQEGFCNAVLEAQALGKLCIVSDAEGLAENVMHGETGWVVPRFQTIQLANQIMQVCALPESQRQQVQQQAQQRVQSQFNLEQQQEAFHQFYTQVL